MLFLVLAHRDMGRIVKQDIGRLEHGIDEQADRGTLAILADLVLELRHAVQPADPGSAVQQPAQLGMGRHARLVEQDGPIRIDARRNQGGGHVANIADARLASFMHSDRMHVGQKEEALAVTVHLILHPHPVADCAKIIAKMQIAGGLDAGKDAHC